jgi:2-C-methyl-D-erythritol 2,4-cyclodiphosphate synthase
MSGTRVGIGYDSHAFVEGGRPLTLGGVVVPGGPSVRAHSDGDAVCHAVTDAILGAVGAGDIGALFPDTDPANDGKDSIEMLTSAVAVLHARGWRVGNVDVTVVLERPKIGPHRAAMQARLAAALGIPAHDVGIKGKTNEQMGFVGRGEGVAVMAVALVERTT